MKVRQHSADVAPTAAANARETQGRRSKSRQNSEMWRRPHSHARDTAAQQRNSARDTTEQEELVGSEWEERRAGQGQTLPTGSPIAGPGLNCTENIYIFGGHVRLEHRAIPRTYDEFHCEGLR